MNKELFDAIDLICKEKGIDKEAILGGIKNALLKSCEKLYGTSENVQIEVDDERKEFRVLRLMNVVSTVEDGREKLDIALDKALLYNPSCAIGDVVRIELEPKNFSRIAAQDGKNIILQKIREEERQSVSDYFLKHQRDVMTGVVSRVMNGGIVSVNLGKADAVLTREDMIPGESFAPGDHVKVYVVGMRDVNNKGPRVQISRTKPAMVKRLFELEVAEIKEGTVEIKAISREAGSRTKMAVWSNDENVDPIGACIGVNGSRINAVVDELNGEKIDIIHWDENPAFLVENALSPAKVIAVAADEDEKTALVVVPDNQLSLAIGMKGQNARLAAKLTGYKIDIKSETQAHEEGLFDEYEEEDEDYVEDAAEDTEEASLAEEEYASEDEEGSAGEEQTEEENS